MNATVFPLFDYAETERVARLVGFNPLAGLARECLLDTQRTAWSFPDGLSEKQKFQAHFYLALGLFIWCEYGDRGLPVPAVVSDWYLINTAAATDETLFITGLSA
jgi:hypothetical protein